MTETLKPCELHITRKNGPALQISLVGDWIHGAKLPPADEALAAIGDGSATHAVVFDTARLARWDSRLLTFLVKLIHHSKVHRVEIDLQGLPVGVRGLINLALTVPERADAQRRSETSSLLVRIGKMLINAGGEAKALVEFTGEILLSGAKLMIGQAKFRPIDLAVNVQACGPSALPIVTVISLLVGLILAFVGALQLAMFGAQIYIADMVALGMVREMGALMTGVIMSGRTGAAFAAQLGTMNVNSEIDALKTMGIAPMEFLVLPRMVALILVMPLLCLYADLMGILGGALVTLTFFDVTPTQYYNQTTAAADLTDFAVGIFKCTVFGILIAIAGCMRGMQCGRSASAVGDAATSAVVTSIVFLVVSDAIMTIIFNRLDI